MYNKWSYLLKSQKARTFNKIPTNQNHYIATPQEMVEYSRSDRHEKESHLSSERKPRSVSREEPHILNIGRQGVVEQHLPQTASASSYMRKEEN